MRVPVQMPPFGRANIPYSALIVILICVVAFLLRLLTIVLLPNINRPDEIFQTLEQAHRIVYGTGILPWEFVYGARSYILPGALASVMWVAKLFGGGPDAYLPMIYAVLAALSTGCVLVTYLWANRYLGLAGGITAAVVIAFSVDAIYFGPRTAPEVISTHLILIATYLCEPGYHVTSQPRLTVGGILFGLAFLLRFHYAAAIALIVVWTCYHAPKTRMRSVLGAATVTVLLGGLLDWVTWSYPFESIWRNFVINMQDGAAASFGVDGWYKYILYMAWYWSSGAAVLFGLALIGATRLPVLFGAAALVLLQHSLIAHKEFGFIYLSILFGIVLAAIGMARIVAWLAEHAPVARAPNRRAQICVSAAAAFWISFSLGEATSWGYTLHWFRAKDELHAAIAVARTPMVCGVGLRGVEWYYSGGYTYMNQPGRLYLPKNNDQLTEDAPGFNVLLYRGKLPKGLAFKKRQCYGEVCLAQRPGGCAPIPTPITPQIPPMLRNVTPERETGPQ